MRFLLLPLFWGMLALAVYAQCPTMTLSTEFIPCVGDSDGSVTIDASGGIMPYQYSIDNGQTFQLDNFFDNLTAVCDSAVVMDALGCTVKEAFCVVEPLDALTLITDIGNIPACFALCDASAYTIASGGITPYTYLWSTGSNWATVQDLCAGVYTATVTDAVGCTATASVEITEPPQMAMALVSVEEESCNGNGDGQITITTSGGTGNFYIVIDNEFFGTDTVLSNMAGGVYTVIGTDDNGCMDSIPNVVVNTMYSTTEISLDMTNETCLGTDGTVTATAMNGTPPYSYQWSNGENTAFISGLSPGNYGVTVTGSDQCRTFADTLVESFFDIQLSSTLATCNQNDGTATISISAPVNPSIAWSNGQTTATATGLATGWYSVTLLDDGCQTHRNILVDEDPDCTVEVEGYVVNDEAVNDCNLDGSSLPLPYRQLRLWSGSTLVEGTYTDAQGYYYMEADPGNYELEIGLQDYDSLLCQPSTIMLNATDVSQSYSNDFLIGIKDVNDLKIDIWHSPARPGFNYYTYVHVKNQGNTQINGSVEFFHDTILTDFVAQFVYDTYNPNVQRVTWAFDLLPMSSQIYTLQFLVPADTPIGTFLELTGNVEPVNGDNTPDNNSDVSHQIVTGSYDPNDKRNFSAVDPFGGDINVDEETYQYMVRFQNTGTDTAFTVVVRDEIDENLDLNSLRVIAASHEHTLDLENGNELVFFFQDIMLPDSNINEPASHGFITYTIDRKEGLPLGTEISNQAAIYFDFNAPVLTNTVVNTLADPMAISALPLLGFELAVQPNLVEDEAVITLKMEQAATVSLHLVDLQGRQLATVKTKAELGAGTHHFPLNTSLLGPGIYFLHLQTNEGVLTKKLISN